MTKYAIVWSNGKVESVKYSGLGLVYARELAELYACEHAERIDVSYWSGDPLGNSFKLTTNNGTTVTYSVREDETK